jgi:hypothetical protein
MNSILCNTYVYTHTRHSHATVILTRYIVKLNAVALVRERTLPTERRPLVGEVSAKICV